VADVERDSKTEAASQRRREQSRAEGQVAYSADLSTGVVLLVLAGVLWLAGPMIGQALMGNFRDSLGGVSTTEWSVTHATLSTRWVLASTWSSAGWLAAVLVIASVGAGVLQAGFHISTEAIGFKWERLLPTRGWEKLLSAESFTKVIAALAKIAIAVVVVWYVLRHDWDAISTAGRGNVRHAVAVGWSTGVWLLMLLGLCALVIGAADYGFHWWRHEQNLKMSKEEVKQEQKEENGDPHLKSRQRRLQREMRKPKGFKNVATATVVLTNPTHYAVALLYDANSMTAPRVVAKGAGAAALRIRKLAAKHNVPVLERKPLARALYKMCDIGKEIPLELYQAIAEILAFVYKQKRAG
jgi:flagellar biosynthetic protein FlhB